MPEDFRFSVKLTREITHVKELQGDLAALDIFMRSASGTANKKGCLLVQFPGKIKLDYFKQVEQIMEELHQLDVRDQWKKAVEFRDPGWYTGETWELLDSIGATMVLHDIPKARILETRGSASFVYLRFHGPVGDYRGSYTEDFLKARATDIKAWNKAGKEVYIYFNNTIGNAFENAMSLKAMV